MAAIQNAVPEFELGDRFRKARKLRGFSLKQMAKMLTDNGRETGHSSVSAWELGTTQPRQLVELVKLYELLTGIPEDWFWTGGMSTVTLRDQLSLAGQMAFPITLGIAA